MCGIFSYLGDRSASDAVIRGLGRLEYRGYDSAGICTLSADGQASLVRSVGRVAMLAGKLESR
jgi:glutamine---fructose-6-phosphate transaminase (isomerizing)